jgi:hypothetical protein
MSRHPESGLDVQGSSLNSMINIIQIFRKVRKLY